MRHQNPIFLGKAKFLFWLFLFCILPIHTAQARSYSYDAIEYDVSVNTNSTVDIAERQTYRFVGGYHQGWRNIPMNGVDAITDISVVDGNTGLPLVYSSVRLQKTLPSNWGKYTTFVENGEQIIEWYYDAYDTTRTFVLRYTVHGAIGFYRDHDEFYWNLATQYSVPINRVEATVRLPQPVEKAKLTASTYVEPLAIASAWSAEKGLFRFSFENIPSYGKVTIAPGWPKDIVDESAYWMGFLSRTWGYWGSLLVVLIAIFAVFLRWYFTERYRTGRGAIVPQYDPPENLRPAIAEIVVTERLTDKAWTATIVDLAVKGYIAIQEEPRGLWMIKRAVFIAVGMFFIIASGFLVVYMAKMSLWNRTIDVMYAGAVGIIFVIAAFKRVSPKDYILQLIGDPNSQDLEKYEKKFLEVFFHNSKTFSTYDTRKNREKSQSLSILLRVLRQSILDDMPSETQAYDVGFRFWRYVRVGIFISGSVVVGAVFASMVNQFSSTIPFLMTLVYCLVSVFLFFRYNPRLNHRGQILREDWLGFKMYLETAERYRMQNLTPETFEKYLPYAIIFGVEKQWGKAFESIATENPLWYSGVAARGGSSSFASPGTSFSASAFSASFASSFSSAFASSGASSGSSGGGGSAGSGGGGGGGGAS